MSATDDLRAAIDAVRRSRWQDPAVVLPLLGELESAVRDARAISAVRARVERGWSYGQIGRALGISPQGARKAFAELAELHLRRKGQ